jgi:hypothetical protein
MNEIELEKELLEINQLVEKYDRGLNEGFSALIAVVGFMFSFLSMAAVSNIFYETTKLYISEGFVALLFFCISFLPAFYIYKIMNKYINKIQNKEKEKIFLKIKNIEKTNFGLKHIFENSIETFRYLNKNLSHSYSQAAMKVHKNIISGDMYNNKLFKIHHYSNYTEFVQYLNYILTTEYIHEKNTKNKIKEETEIKEKKNIIKDERSKMKKEKIKKDIKSLISNFFTTSPKYKDEFSNKDKKHKNYSKVKSI